MAHDNAPLHHSGIVKDGLPCLPHHFRQRFLCPVGIVRRLTVTRRQRRIHIFEVRQVNIHQSGQQPQCLRVLIPAGVVHDGQIQSAGPGLLEHRRQRRKVMGGRHQIDVGRPLFFQRKENLQKPLRGNVFARPAIGNIPVLAEDAAQITAGEKHRAGTGFP